MNVNQVKILPGTWDPSALFVKAQRYAEAMLETTREDWRFGLLSSFALEFLARAALANVSPTLLADPKDWNNLYYSLGHEPKAKKFSPKSITVAEVFSRLKEISEDFSTELESFCISHTTRRNAELHSGETPFDTIKSSRWLPSYYECCAVLLKGLDSSLVVFLERQRLRSLKL